jgi:hypothetical protein
MKVSVVYSDTSRRLGIYRHGARTSSRHEYFAGIRIVLTDGPGHHVGD